MQIVILCGGRASRLGNLSKKKPKSLIKFQKIPFVVHQMQLLKSYGFKNFLLCNTDFNKECVPKIFV